MTRRVQIDQYSIGEGSPCFVMAEAGSNHNGRLGQAKRLIEVAAKTGVNAVKFQLFRADKLYPKTAGLSDYLREDRPIYDIIAEMEMPYEWLEELASTCREKGVLFLASVFDEESVDRVDPYVAAFKIASYEMTHHPLVRYVARKGKPVIMATGTAHLQEVKESVEVFLGTGNPQLILMQCTAAYPAPLDSLNVRAITTLKKLFNVPVGLSDHSRDPLIGPLTAVAVGANLIEKHFTLSNELPGPDHGFAVEPDELALMVQKIRQVEQVLGDGDKTVQKVEWELRDFARRQLVAFRDIALGETFTSENAAVLRRGKLLAGLEPKYYEQILGRVAQKAIQAGSAIQEGDYA